MSRDYVRLCVSCYRTEDFCHCIVPEFVTELRAPFQGENAAICELDGCKMLDENRVRPQTKTQSLLEVFVSYAIGFIVALITNMLVLKAWGFQASVMDNIWITIIFTVVSIIRSYLVRRFFVHIHR